MSSTGHYSYGQRPEQLSIWSKEMAADIKCKIPKPILVYRGMSGISAAVALSLQLFELGVEHGMVYVRKPDEEHHGFSVERNIPTGWDDIGDYIFVDDFISSGTTRMACEEKINKFFNWVAVQEICGSYTNEVLSSDEYKHRRYG